MSTTTNYDYSTTYGDYGTTGGVTSASTTAISQVSSDNCLQYVYLVWVYFLYYVGAGYESYYYPYILNILLDYVPASCGGTGGTDSVSSSALGLDQSLALLSLQQQQDTSPLSIQVQSSGAGYNPGYNTGINSGFNTGFNTGLGGQSLGTNSGSLASFGIQEPQVIYPNGRKRREAKKSRKKKSRKKARQKKRKQKNRKKKGSVKKERKKTRQKKRKTRRKGKKRKSRKKRKNRRLKLGTSLRAENVGKVEEGFRKGRSLMKGVDRFLEDFDFPFKKNGKLKKTFKGMTKKKAYLRLPGYCEKAKIEDAKKKKSCQKRAKRIKKRIMVRKNRKNNKKKKKKKKND